MKAILMLEDGAAFEGKSFGAEGEAAGWVIFNTQVVGFQEILTDPANENKIIAFGYPHIGNAGINDKSYESDEAAAAAFVVKEYSKIYSNWQAKESLAGFMQKHKVIGIEGIDTRALTIHLRENGEMRGVVSTQTFDTEKLIEKAKAYQEGEFKFVEQKAELKAAKSRTVIINIGVNKSILNKFPGAAVVRYDMSAENILKLKPELVVISGGPGDPTKMTGLIEEVKQLIGKVEIYGIQNGACILALALGCKVSRMKAGHHGVNHSVVDPKTGKGEISVQNHSFGIYEVSEGVEVVHVNLNDKTIEKIQSRDGKCVGTLYLPIDERGKLDKGYQYV